MNGILSAGKGASCWSDYPDALAAKSVACADALLTELERTRARAIRGRDPEVIR
jgi:hypothetical protein